MNKNEFYKQLMSEYSFDADKIRENAKRGKNARQKLQPMYIGMTAAAAALVVTVGTLAAVNLTKDNGVSLTDSGLATLSANDRVIHAIEQLEKERRGGDFSFRAVRERCGGYLLIVQRYRERAAASGERSIRISLRNSVKFHQGIHSEIRRAQVNQ